MRNNQKSNPPNFLLLGIEGMLKKFTIRILDQDDLAQKFRAINKLNVLKGKLFINLFFESSIKSLLSFKITYKELWEDTINISVSTSCIKKEESLISREQPWIVKGHKILSLSSITYFEGPTSQEVAISTCANSQEICNFNKNKNI